MRGKIFVTLLVTVVLAVKATPIAQPTGSSAMAESLVAAVQAHLDEDDDEKSFNRLSDMITKVQKALVEKTHAITATVGKNNKTQLTKQDVAQIAQLRKRYESLDNFRRLLVQQKRKQQHSKKQYQECVRSLGKAICNQNTTFYLWAQMLAKDILSRPMEKPLELAEE